MDDVSEIKTSDVKTQILDKQFSAAAKNDRRLTAKFEQMNKDQERNSTVRVGKVYKTIQYGTNKTNTVVYLYNLTSSDPSETSESASAAITSLKLTNLNRVQFVLNVAEGSSSSKVLAFVAVKKEDEWVFSDNLVVYDGTHDSLL